MRSWILLAGLSVLIISLVFPTVARAGGWTVVTLDKLPENIVVGQSYPLDFMVRQHGRTPFSVDVIAIRATHRESAEKLTFAALPAGSAGHYHAELVFTRPGAWEWGVETGLYPQVQPMPDLVVSADQAGLQGAAQPAGLLSSPMVSTGLLGLFALAGLLAVVFLIVRKRPARVYPLAILGLLAIAGGLAFVLLSSANAETLDVPKAAGPAETGQRLFLAKGCVVCHVNNRALDQSQSVSVEMGPNLTRYANDPAYLRAFLASPGTVKSASEMPTLGLTSGEIDALVLFLNEGDSK